jgi:hypothetical protein
MLTSDPMLARLFTVPVKRKPRKAKRRPYWRTDTVAALAIVCVASGALAAMVL